MIAYLRGELLSCSENYAVIMVGGVGYRVEMHPSAMAILPACGEEVGLHVYTAVREDAITLIGFAALEARELFELLLGVSGVGPRLALSIVSHSDIGRLKAAMAGEEIAYLVKIPGVGRRTAERIVVDLKDKIKNGLLIETVRGGGPAVSPDTATEAAAVLIELGYTQPRAREAVRQAVADVGSEAGVEEMIRAALRYLGSA